MIVIPAIDIRGGRCVRLVQGARDAELPYEEDPGEVARRFVEDQGAHWLHVIDLDGALGDPAQREAVEAVLRVVGARVPVQVGGGIRELDAVNAALDAGASRVIVGTRALRDPEWLKDTAAQVGADALALAVDVGAAGDVKVAGWEESTPLSLPAAFEIGMQAGLTRAVVTAIERDGTMTGPGTETLVRALDVAAGRMRIQAAGGIGTLDHVRALSALRGAERTEDRIEAAVMGRAIYEGRFEVKDAIVAARRSAAP